MKTEQATVLLIYTGGTIGMKRNPLTGALESVNFDSLLTYLPELKQFDINIDTCAFNPPVDSSNMTPGLWARIASIIEERYDSYDGFVILHGTDTMSYTASALSFMLGNLSKPVILTGSQLPVGQLRTDGKENLITAIEIAATRRPDGRAMAPEVCVYFNNSLYRGNRTTKRSADQFTAFESFNYPPLAEAGIDIHYHPERILSCDPSRPLRVRYRFDANVIVMSLFPGYSETIARQLFAIPGLKAIVMRTFGSGNAPQNDWLLQSLRQAADRGIVIVNISQCVNGSVEMNRYDPGLSLLRAGVISGRDSTVESAVTKLMLLLGEHNDPDAVRQLMNRSLCGEVTIEP